MSIRDSQKKAPVKRRRWLRALTILLICLCVLGLAGYIAFPHIVNWFIKGKIADAAESLDRQISYEGFELERLNRYHFRNLVISDETPNQGEPFLTISELTLTLDRTRLFTGRVAIREVELIEPVFHLRDYPDGVSNYADMESYVRGFFDAPEQGPEQTSPTTPSTEQPQQESDDGMLEGFLALGIPVVTIVDGRIAIDEVENGAPIPGVRDFDLAVEPLGESFACNFAFSTDFDDITSSHLARPVNHIEISGYINPDDEQGDIMFSGGEPLELTEISGFPELQVRVGGVGFEYPYSFRLQEVEVFDRRTRSRVLLAPELNIELRSELSDAVEQLTSRPEDFYISLVEGRGIRLFAEIDREGRTNFDRILGISEPTLGALLPEQETDDTPTGDPGPPDSPNVDTDPVPEREPSALEQELSSRRWWEIMPQTTDFTDITMEIVVHEDGRPIRTLDVSIPSIRAGQRLLNFQMDLTSRIELSERGLGEIGAIDVSLVYYWVTEHWDLNLDFFDVNLGQLVEVLPYPNPFNIQNGSVSGNIGLSDERPENDITLSGDLELLDFAFTADPLAELPVDDINVGYAFTGTFDNDTNFTMNRGLLTAGDVSAELMLNLTALDLNATWEYLTGFNAEHTDEYWAAYVDSPPPWQEAHLTIFLEPHPIMDVFHAVPAALRTGLTDVEMTGTVGWHLDARATFERRDDGRLRVQIPPPEVADVLDETVELVAIPPELDPRRLVEGFSFTFIDGIGEMRQLTIGLENPRWVPLINIAPAMINAILTTEDQGFFENDGFNWYQMRRVVADFLANQEFGRGASTISMQLVKNIFLSRERLLSRKISEMFITYWMTRFVPKEVILETYLNVIEFGPSINGIAEAAEHYYGKLPSELTLAESVFLVSIVPNPRLYYPFYQYGEITDHWWERMQRYIERMFDREVITEEEYEAAIRHRPEFYIREEGDPAMRPPEMEWQLPFLDDEQEP